MDSLSFKAVDFAIQLAVILFAISFHESAHAFAALKFGDTTARDLGRISLNPIRHIDAVGSIILPLLLYFTSGLIFGYAKPTPVQLERTRNPRLADVVVSAAGPLSNVFLAVISVIVLFLLRRTSPAPRIQDTIVAPLWYIFVAFLKVNVSLGLFNLVPIPPLDGSWVLAAVFGERVRLFFLQFGRFGFVILIVLSYTGVLGRVLIPILRMIYGAVERVLA